MIKFDYKTYMNQEVSLDSLQKEELIQKLLHNPMAGFINHVIHQEEMEEIKRVASQIKADSEVLLVIGIGGSFMGSYALKNMFLSPFKTPDTEVIYLGYHLSSEYLKEVLDYIQNKDVSVNVISKSGTTMEISLTYSLIKKELEKKYSKEELQKRIIITTDSEKGRLREEVNQEGYLSFSIPSDIGGRYSLMSPAHLLPLAVMDLDIDNLLLGYKEGLQLIDEAYQYANLRVNLFHQNKLLENFSIYDPSLYYYTEWIKQLLAESEGKNQKGIFPISTVNTRDLHSLGQFIQEGNPILFETVIRILNSEDIKIEGVSLNKINQIVTESVCAAHYNGDTPSIIISLEKLDMRHIGSLSAFFMLAAAFSSYLFDVDPFNQPGVEAYKKEVRKNLEEQKIDFFL